MVFVSRKWDDSTTGDDFETGYKVCEPTKIEVKPVSKLFVEGNMIIYVKLNKTTKTKHIEMRSMLTYSSTKTKITHFNLSHKTHKI